MFFLSPGSEFNPDRVIPVVSFTCWVKNDNVMEAMEREHLKKVQSLVYCKMLS